MGANTQYLTLKQTKSSNSHLAHLNASYVCREVTNKTHMHSQVRFGRSRVKFLLLTFIEKRRPLAQHRLLSISMTATSLHSQS